MIDPLDDKPALAIPAASAAGRYGDVVARCKRHPPDRPALYVPCLVSACQLKNGALALAWLSQARRQTRPEILAVNRALNRCRDEAGIDLGRLKKQQTVEPTTGDDHDL